jgi:glycerophosphoryl diester phosphodiesterase
MIIKDTMRKLLTIIIAAFAIISCSSEKVYSTRAEKILAEINDPNSEYVVVISHRGDWRNWPENSIPAIESIIKMGVDMMELDVKMTKDSVLVLMHDKNIDRMTNGKGFISDMTYDSLMTFNLKRAHNVPTKSIEGLDILDLRDRDNPLVRLDLEISL